MLGNAFTNLGLFEIMLNDQHVGICIWNCKKNMLYVTWCTFKMDSEIELDIMDDLVHDSDVAFALTPIMRLV